MEDIYDRGRKKDGKASINNKIKNKVKRNS